MTFAEFTAQRRPHQTQFFPTLGAKQTILVCSHIWWTDQIAFAILNAGHNVLIHSPFYLLYTNDAAFDQFDQHWNQILQTIRHHKVDLILAGNSAGLCPHPNTGELLHRAANDGKGIPIVHYWWDEPRAKPPFAQRTNFLPEDYLRFLRDPLTLNVIWDLDILEELAAFHQITNTLHVPLATLPEYWHVGPPDAGPIPLEQRPLAACFLGNFHGAADWVETDRDPLTAWGRRIISQKIANLDTPMKSCIDSAGPPPTKGSSHLAWRKDPWSEFFVPWELLNSVYMHRTRNLLVKAAADHLKGKLALIGKGWDQLGLRANAEHAGEKSAFIYAQSKASLNLFGGCVHAGMPLRPYDIAASGGLILTHYNRELPSLFEPDKECLAFRNQSEMLALLDRVLASPAEFNPLPVAARRRVLAQHTWSHRIQKILQAAESLR